VNIGSRQWTFLHYLNGDNNLRESVTANLARLHAEGSSDQVQVVASLYRGQPEWSLKSLLSRLVGGSSPIASATDWRGQKTFEVRQQDSAAESSSPLIGSADQTRPSDWHHLRDFLIQNMQAYPAQNYALFVSSHGAGEEGLLSDSRGQRMSVDDFRRAIREAEEATGQEISLVALEACSMGRAAVVDKLHEVSEYIVASPVPITTNQVAHQSLLALAKQHPDWSADEMARATHQVYSATVPSMQLFGG